MRPHSSMRLAFRCPLTPSILLSLLASVGYAADVTSTLIGSGSWSNAGIWDSPQYPDNGNGGFTYNAAVYGSVAVDQNITIDGLLFTGGQISGPSLLTVGSLDWQGGIFASGSTTKASGGVWSGGGKYLDGAMQVDGAIAWTAGDINPYFSLPPTGTLGILDDGVLQVSGSGLQQLAMPLSIESGGRVVHSSTGQWNTGRLNLNGGTLQVDAGMVSVNGAYGAGSVYVGSGANLDLNGGTLTGGEFDVAADGRLNLFGGAINGHFAGASGGAVHLSTVAVTGPSSISGMTAQIDGVVYGPADLTIENVDWRQNSGFTANHGPAPSSPGVVTLLGGKIQGSGAHYLDRTLRIAGEVDWQAGVFQAHAYVPTTGRIEVAAGGTLVVSGTENRNTHAPIVIETGGVLHHSSAGSTTSNDPLVNDGTVRVDNGSLTFAGLTGSGGFEVAAGGAFYLAGGELRGNFTGTGPGAIHILYGTVAAPSSITGITVQIDGTVFGPGDLTIERVDWRAGGGFPIATAGVTTLLGGVIQGNGAHYVDRTVRIEGDIDCLGGAFTPYYSIPPTGRVQIATDAWLTFNGSGDRVNGVPIEIESGGRFQYNSTGNYHSNASMTNNGLLEVTAGAVNLPNGVHNEGLIHVSGGQLTLSGLNNQGLVSTTGGQVIVSDYWTSATIPRERLDINQNPESHNYTGLSITGGNWHIDGGSITFLSQFNQSIIRNRGHITLKSGSVGNSHGLSDLLENEGFLELVNMNFANDQFGTGIEIAGSFTVEKIADELRLIYTAGVIAPGPFPGDFDQNGRVNGLDLAVWNASFGHDGGADANSNGDSDGDDFLVWQRNLGRGVTGITTTVVPEPGSLILAAMAWCSAAGFGRWRRLRAV